jgi:hypothetical protein
MTKRYGALVGAVTQQVPAVPVDMAFKDTSDHILVRDQILLAAAPIADTISLGIFGWETVLDPVACDVYFDALGANSTLSIGDVNYPAALAAATDTHTAAGSVKALKTITIGNWFQPLWQQLGYASLAAARLVETQCELLATIAGGAATGNVVWQFKGQKRI